MYKSLLVFFVIVSVSLVGVDARNTSALTTDDVQAEIQEILSKISDLTNQLNALRAIEKGAVTSGGVSSTIKPTPAPFKHRVCNVLERNLSAGAQGDDVRSLQEFLYEQKMLTVTPTGYFGQMTAEAVRRWQANEGVQVVGAFGPRSRERIKMGCDGIVNKELFSASPARGVAPLTVVFDTWLSGFRVQSISYTIDFGDGVSERATDCYAPVDACQSPGQNSHTYSTNGIYNATLNRITDPCNGNPMCMAPVSMEVIGKAQIYVGQSDINLVNKPPVISGFSGPTMLALNTTGTWTINASDPENGQLSYQIWWGDENMYAPNASIAGATREFSQMTIFTHAYANMGTYTVLVVVRDNVGQEAKTSMTVKVGSDSVACTLQYDPVCGRPSGCANTCPSGMYCTTVCQLHQPQTYSNRCFLNSAGATFLHNGQCTSTSGSI